MSGYYKLNEINELMYGPMVSLPTGVVLAGGPMPLEISDGWIYFNSEEEAIDALKPINNKII